MTDRADSLIVLARGLDQAERLLSSVTDDDLPRRTPCEGWEVADLADHLVSGTAAFVRTVRGEEVDWTAPTPHIESDLAAAFRLQADRLLAAWGAVPDDAGQPPPDWQTAEIAVHSYDLATALGLPTAELDVEVAERGLAFMRANLRAEMRSTAFAPEQPSRDGADAYQRIAAFAGRIGGGPP
jgi:uncharacterized protein (TIGR03083 family)